MIHCFWLIGELKKINLLENGVKYASFIEKYDFVTNEFPDINKHEDFKEEGMELFVKVTDDINKKKALSILFDIYKYNKE